MFEESESYKEFMEDFKDRKPIEITDEQAKWISSAAVAVMMDAAAHLGVAYLGIVTTAINNMLVLALEEESYMKYQRNIAVRAERAEREEQERATRNMAKVEPTDPIVPAEPFIMDSHLQSELESILGKIPNLDN